MSVRFGLGEQATASGGQGEDVADTNQLSPGCGFEHGQAGKKGGLRLGAHVF